MIYNNSKAGDIGYESSHNSSNKPKLFTPMEISPLPYSHQVKKRTQKPNSNFASSYKLNLEIKSNDSEINCHKIKYPENIKQKENFSVKLPNRKISSPEISRKKIDTDYSFDKNIFRGKSTDKKIRKKKVRHQKSLEIFNEKFDSLVNAITTHQIENHSTFSTKNKKCHYLEDDNNLDNNELNEYNNNKKEIRKKKRKTKTKHLTSRTTNSFKVGKKELDSLEEEAKSMTNTIEIANFYEYTKKCMKIIIDVLEEKEKAKIPNKVKILNPNNRKKLAVFDLDETLIHGVVNTQNYRNKDNILSIILPSKKIAKIGVNIRPHWEEAIQRISKLYNIVIYTASHASYADSVLDFIDPEKKYFYNRLYRSNCIDIKIDGTDIYIKDLNIFEDFNLKDILIVDNSVLAFAFHLDNGIPILPYYEAKNDYELLFCAYYFESIFEYDDLREVNKKFMKLDYYLKQAKIEKEKEEEYEEDEDEEESDTTSQTKLNNNYKLDKFEKGKSEENIILVNWKEEKKKDSKFCEELKIDFNTLRTKFSQDHEK